MISEDGKIDAMQVAEFHLREMIETTDDNAREMHARCAQAAATVGQFALTLNMYQNAQDAARVASVRAGLNRHNH